MGAPTFLVEVITVPVSDVERALRFYVDQVGFTLDVDYSPNDAFRVVQLTPPGFPGNCHAAELTLLSVANAEAATLCC